jgi:hypothetical protein
MYHNKEFKACLALIEQTIPLLPTCKQLFTTRGKIKILYLIKLHPAK